MKSIARIILFTFAVSVLGAGPAYGQFYSWGNDPASFRWRKMKGENAQMIFPDSLESTARRTMFYVDAVKPYVGYGYRHPAMKMPFILHPENFRSNGMVMYLPKRVEMLTSPAVDGYSMPWMKQLVAHEFRHAVQYNNLNRGVVRVLSYILGQQSSTFGLLFLPLWLIEGDATMCETQMSSFGRGLQPGFTLDYRALGNITGQRRNIDKWFCGSYRENIPDHYHLGYQVASYAYKKYDGNIWDKVAWYSVRNPYVIATTAVSLKKFYSTSVTKLTRETFDDLDAWWSSLPAVENSSSPVPQSVQQRSYTVYKYPVAISDTEVLSLKNDLDTPSHFVITDIRDGSERRLAYTGSVSTRPTVDSEGRVWWTEYRRSTLFAEKVNSTLCYMSLDKNRPRSVRKRRDALYPTATGDGLAWVEYDMKGVYSIVAGDGFGGRSRVSLPSFTEIHGLAYDNATQRLYFIATDDDGMHLGGVDEKGDVFNLTDGAYITLSDLRARDGKLYFGSIESGRDEVHCYDIAAGREYRLTTSEFGSFAGSPLDGGHIVMTTYDAGGYHLATQDAGRVMMPVEPRRLPVNLVNPPRVTWDVINIDTVRYTAADSLQSSARYRARRYSKALHLFNVHSWAPLSYNPFEIMEEGLVNVNIGATIMSQNLLSDSEMFLSYGWNRAEGSIVQGTWRYYGLGVNLSLSAFYGGTQRLYTIGRYNPATERVEIPDVPELKKYYSVSAAASLPLMFQGGYHTRYLNVSAAWNFSNGLVARVDRLSVGDLNTSNFMRLGYARGVHTLQFGITWQDMVQQAHKDFAPRFGYLVNATYAMNADNTNFSNLLALYGRVYLPGVVRHHSVSLAAAYQTSIGGFHRPNIISDLSYTSSRLLPRGYTTRDIRNDDYVAVSFNYQLPVWYPEGGIPSVLYFKRIRLNAGFDYATFDNTTIQPITGSLVLNRRHIFSYGGDLIFDINLFRQPASATTAVTLSAYVTREGKPFFKAGVGLPF